MPRGLSPWRRCVGEPRPPGVPALNGGCRSPWCPPPPEEGLPLPSLVLGLPLVAVAVDEVVAAVVVVTGWSQRARRGRAAPVGVVAPVDVVGYDDSVAAVGLDGWRERCSAPPWPGVEVAADL